jgi:HSP20 family protein
MVGRERIGVPHTSDLESLAKTYSEQRKREEHTMGMRWDPFRDALSLREAMDRLLEQSVVSPRGAGAPSRGGSVTLPVDLWETPESLVVRVPLPGVKVEADDVEIGVDGNVLTIRATLPGAAGEDSQAPGEGIRWIYREIPRGEARRTIELPIAVDADAATAHFANGLLLQTLPKAQTARPRKINVTPG